MKVMKHLDEIKVESKPQQNENDKTLLTKVTYIIILRKITS